MAHHGQLLADFLKRFWEFYDQLLAYRSDARAEDKRRLSAEFDTLFSTVTGYRALDEWIEKTGLKKSSLLMVLDHPEIPLHNNPAELGVRLRVRKRDVSFGPRTQEGAKAWDAFMTIDDCGHRKKVRSKFLPLYSRSRLQCPRNAQPCRPDCPTSQTVSNGHVLGLLVEFPRIIEKIRGEAVASTT